MRIENMRSPKGNTVPNQFIIFDQGKTYFQSYTSIIAVIEADGSVSLDKYLWGYSRTTGKYRNMFLGESKSETERKIKSGEYKLASLNGGE